MKPFESPLLNPYICAIWLKYRVFDAYGLLTTGVTVANTMDPLRGKESSKTNNLKHHQTSIKQLIL